MNNIEFLKYTPTPNEKYIGIATVRIYGKIVLRFKIVPNKDGSGFFPAPSSYRVQGADGADSYVPSFMLESNYDKEELEDVIRASIKPYIGQVSTNELSGQQGYSNAGFKPQAQTNPSYPQPKPQMQANPQPQSSNYAHANTSPMPPVFDQQQGMPF